MSELEHGLGHFLDEAFDRWTKMVGFDVESTHYSEEYKAAEVLQEARRLDSSGLTAFMLMKAYTTKYVQEEQLSAIDVIRGLSSEQQERINLLRDMLEFLERPAIDAVIDGFVASVRAATCHYGVDHQDLEAWIGSYYWLATIRCDALRAFEKMEVHQFYHGEPASSPRPVYGTKVLEFWNIPSLVRGMIAMGKSGLRGVNLCLVRDPFNGLFSYFVVAAVNGETLTIFTDRDKQRHPEAKKMSRRPDREFVRRAERGWFPYELLKIESSGNRFFAVERDQIVPINAQAVELADFSSLMPSDVVWLSLVFRLIADRYLVENHALPETSYTTEMMRAPNILLAARPEIVEHSTYRPLRVQDLTLEDVSAEATKGQWDRNPLGHNEWMIERYGKQVPESVFNVIGEGELKALPVVTAELVKQGTWDQGSERNKLLTVDPLGFGTKDEIERDRVWTARYNLCKMVQRLAEQEYRESKKAVRSWWVSHLLKNTDKIVEYAVRGELMVEVTRQHKEDFFGIGNLVTKTENMVRTRLGSDWYSYIGHVSFGEYHLPRYDPSSSRYKCFVTGSNTPDYHAVFSPRSGIGIAALLGVDFDSMPWQLQRWSISSHEFYRGNSILERIDPSDWVLHNPWAMNTYASTESFYSSVVIHLSRRAVNAVRKSLGLPKLNWSEEHEKQKERENS